MKEIQLTTESSLIPEEELDLLRPAIRKETSQMETALKNQYLDERASLQLPGDIEFIKTVKSLINEQRKTSPAYLIVIGIGGSNLGTVAIQEAVLGRMYNQKEPTTKILYADTVDSDSLHALISLITPVLQNGGNVLINTVSKSGGTTETIANFEILLDLLKKYREDYQDSIIITTDKNSKFWMLGKNQGFSLLEIPSNVGGRYSVFSPVGLLPLGLLGINIDSLLTGAQVMMKRCLDPTLEANPAALSASLIRAHQMHGKHIHDLFLFDPELESLGKWYRQLMGESIGKEYDRNGVRIHNGITPTVSIGSTDLHSMAQLYLGGPYDKFTTFVRVKHPTSRVMIPTIPEYESLVRGIQGRSLNNIMLAILEGVQNAFRKDTRPFVEVTLPDKTPGSIGQFMQFKMMEMMFLGTLCGVNPFDQPNVEAYKQETRFILEKTT